MIGLLETNEEKIKFLIKDYFKLSQKKLADTFGVSETEMSKIVNNQEKKLKNVHLLGFCQLHDVPYEVFSNKKINTEEKLTSFLDNYKNSKTKKISNNNSSNPLENMISKHYREEILNKIKGKWYLHLYNSQAKNEIWIMETNIKSDATVEHPYNDSHGYLHIRQGSSYIEKYLPTFGMTALIRFSNTNIAYKLFYVSINSIDIAEKRPIVNLAFMSRKKYSEKETRNILSSYEKSQLKLDSDFHDRIIKEQQY